MSVVTIGIKPTPFPRQPQRLSISFRPNHPARTGITGERTRAGFRRVGGIVHRDATDRHLEIALDLLFYAAGPVPMGQRKAAVDFWASRILWRKEGVELFLRIDLARVRVAKLRRA